MPSVLGFIQQPHLIVHMIQHTLPSNIVSLLLLLEMPGWIEDL